MTDTKKVYDTDGLALYFRAYMSDVEYAVDTDSPSSKMVEKEVDGVREPFLEGERLKYYPTGMQLFTASRGMARPIVEKMGNGAAMERVRDCKMVYRETYAIGGKWFCCGFPMKRKRRAT